MKNYSLLLAFCCGLSASADMTIEGQVGMLFDRFLRDFTVLDLIGKQEFAAGIIKQKADLDFCYIMFCDSKNFALQNGKVIALSYSYLSDFLKKLPKSCLDFDITLVAGSFVKNRPWILKSIVNSSWFTVVVSPAPDLCGDSACDNLLNCFVSKEVAIFTRNSRKMMKKDAFEYVLENSFDSKKFYKPDGVFSWKKGIALTIFAKNGGFWPTYEVLEREVYRNFTLEHGDYMPWNLLVQGDAIAAIDGYEQKVNGIAEKFNCLKKTVYWLRAILKLKLKRAHTFVAARLDLSWAPVKQNLLSAAVKDELVSAQLL